MHLDTVTEEEIEILIQRLTGLPLDLGITLRELAILMSVHPMTLARYLRGEVNISHWAYVSLALAVPNLDMNWLLGFSDGYGPDSSDFKLPKKFTPIDTWSKQAFIDRLDVVRKKNGLSWNLLGHTIGMHWSTIHNMRKHQANIDISRLVQLRKVLGVDLNSLLRGKGESQFDLTFDGSIKEIGFQIIDQPNHVYGFLTDLLSDDIFVKLDLNQVPMVKMVLKIPVQKAPLSLYRKPKGVKTPTKPREK